MCVGVWGARDKESFVGGKGAINKKGNKGEGEHDEVSRNKRE